MTVTRRTPEEMAQNVRILLNRPDDDDLFQWPEEFLEAFNKAHRRIYRKVAQANPAVLVTETTKTTSDSGLTYDLEDHHFGQLEVWAPPGPPTGMMIPPALPNSSYFGYWVDGTDIRFTRQTVYSPLYIRWVPVTVAVVPPGGDHALPAYCEDMLEYDAAYIMAGKEGFAGNPMKYRELSNREWKGSDDDVSDMGILGILKRSGAAQGFEAAIGVEIQPWYKGIGT